MGKRGRQRRGGRTTPKGTRPVGYRHRAPDDGPGWDEPEPDLMANVRHAMGDDHPLGMLALASSLLEVIDPRDADRFEHSSPEKAERPSRAELLRTFVDVDRPETSALLTAFAAFGTDEVERRRLQRTVAGRGHELPAWLTGLGAAEPTTAMEMTHVLRDGDNVMVGVRLVGGAELTAVVYIDHNMGTLVKDAFVVPEAIGGLARFMEERNDDPDSSLAELPTAEARARIVQAIETGAMTIPAFETDTWPACRPLVEWIVRMLPDGGRGYERPDWSDADRDGLAERFFASALGTPLDDPDHRSLHDSILWFGCDYGPGDPMRWSPGAVEIILLDWIPRKIVADATFLAKAPEVLRAFVRFCHAERGVPARLTELTVEAVDEMEAEYQAIIRSPRPQGPAALLAAMGVLDPDGPWPLLPDEDVWGETATQGYLERAVGGLEALDALNDTPLPDEPFDWTGVADDIRDRVAEVLALTDRGCDELLDAEYRTACRRVLARIANRGPQVFRRRGRPDTAAAAICWSVCRVNDTFDQRQGGFTQKRLLAQFGILSGSVSDRAGTLLDAGGFPRHPADFTLGSPDYLVAARRRAILDRRARLTGF